MKKNLFLLSVLSLGLLFMQSCNSCNREEAQNDAVDSTMLTNGGSQNDNACAVDSIDEQENDNLQHGRTASKESLNGADSRGNTGTSERLTGTESSNAETTVKAGSNSNKSIAYQDADRILRKYENGLKKVNNREALEAFADECDNAMDDLVARYKKKSFSKEEYAEIESRIQKIDDNVQQMLKTW